jgi:DNA-damage-inducible protein J
MTAVLTQKSTDVRSRIEPDLKDRASEVLAACGLNLSDAIRLFLRQVVAQRGLPFEVKAPNAATAAAMREARAMKRAKFRSAQGLFDDLEKAGAAKAGKPAKKQR